MRNDRGHRFGSGHRLQITTRLTEVELQVFLVKGPYLRSLERYKNQTIPVKLNKHAHKHVLEILTTYMETRLDKIFEYAIVLKEAFCF